MGGPTRPSGANERAGDGRNGLSSSLPKGPTPGRVTRWADRLGVEALGRVSWRRKWVGSERPWRVRATSFPEDGTLTERALFLLRLAVLAPSSHNTQPWLFNVADDEIRLFADLSRWLPVADPDKRELYISLGAALENLLLAADRFGLECDVEYLLRSDSIHAATVRLSTGGDSRTGEYGDSSVGDVTGRGNADASTGSVGEVRNRRLFCAIPHRRTNRHEYADRPIPRDDLGALQEICVEDDVSLQFVAEPAGLDAIADLTARADRRPFADPAFRRELGRWIGRGAFGDSFPRAKAKKILVTAVDVGWMRSRWDGRLIRSAPLAAAVRTKGDCRRARIRAGQVSARLGLLATVLDVQTHPVRAALEVEAVRRELTELLGNPEWSTQHLLRLGYADAVSEPSPRRPVDAVLVD